MSETQAGTQQALERYARFLQRTKEMGVVGHRGGLRATRELLAGCDLQPGRRVLEVGCGSGFTACTMAKEHGVSVVALDLEPHLLARAGERARSLRQSERVAPLRADGRSLPFADASFDGVVCESVLAFMADSSFALREFHRVLKPGGFLASHEVTFTERPPEDFLAAIRAAAPGSAGALAVPVDPEEQRRRLEEAGFEVLRTETGDVALGQQLLEQLQIDGFRALKPFFASIFDRELRSSVYRREMAEAQRTFEAHTGYGLYFARRPAEG